MKKRIIITSLVIAVIHLVFSIGSVAIAFGAGMEAFDNPDYKYSAFERIADQLARVLMQPGMFFWTPWMSRNMPDAVEWLSVVVNSLLWGLVIAVIINMPMLIKKKK